MWINITNLCLGDVEEVMKGEEKRASCNVFGDFITIAMRDTEFCKAPGWVIIVGCKHGVDPTLHFTDEAKAKACYDFLVKSIACSKADYVELDALEHGAL